MKIETARKAKKLIENLENLEHNFRFFDGTYIELCDIRHSISMIEYEIENLKDE